MKSMKSQSQIYLKTGRWLAAIAVCGLLIGKSVHHEQSHGECCSVHKGGPQIDADTEDMACPFGCSHHGLDGTTAPQQESDSKPCGHEQHHCSVCSVLAFLVEAPATIEAPDESTMVLETVMFGSYSRQTADFEAVRSRGPPAQA